MYFYTKKVPDMNDLVFAKIIATDDLGVKVKLVEYDNKEGYILYSNLLKRRKNDITQNYKPNKEIVVEFIGYFELEWSFTDKNLDADQIKDYEAIYRKYYKIINLVNSFLGLNKEIDSEYFLNKTIYSITSNKSVKVTTNTSGDGTITEYVEDEEPFDPYNVIKFYDKIIKEEKMLIQLDEPLKSKFYDYIKKHTVDTKFKASIKYESFSVNSSGLSEIKNFYKEIISFAKENNIEIEIKIESLPVYVIYFSEEKYLENITEKLTKVVEYVNSKEHKFNHKLISKNVNEA